VLEHLIAHVPGKSARIVSRSMHRMTVILAPEGEDWAIFFVQMIPVIGR
jgi:hypothetical protein